MLLPGNLGRKKIIKQCLVFAKKILSLEAVAFQVAMVPGTRLAILPGAWMKSFLLCPGVGLAPSLHRRPMAAPGISSTVGLALAVGWRWLTAPEACSYHFKLLYLCAEVD